MRKRVIDSVRLWAADPLYIILLAPILLAVHVAEEAPGFVAWFNNLVSPDITQRQFLAVNAVGMIVTVAIAIFNVIQRSQAAAVAAFGWLAFLFFANAIFHIGAAAVENRYVPGAVTSATLYLPYFAWLSRRIAVRFKLGVGILAVVALAAGAPMYLHGYLIIFTGSRLI